MKGAIVYDKIGYARNEWFAGKLIESAKHYGLDLRLALIEDGVPQNIDFAVVRTIAPALNLALENSGVRVFNNYKTSQIANDKYKTFLFAKENNLPVLGTSYDVENGLLFHYPCVIKSVDGHGGSEVFKAENVAQFNEITQPLKLQNKHFIVQKLCDKVGVDMRIYVLGGDIIASVLRSSDNDFRSNYSLGGDATIAFADDNQKAIVKNVCAKLQPDFIGIDFISNNGQWVLNEIEDVVGCRMLYALTNMEVATAYMQYIASALEA